MYTIEWFAVVTGKSRSDSALIVDYARVLSANIVLYCIGNSTIQYTR